MKLYKKRTGTVYSTKPEKFRERIINWLYHYTNQRTQSKIFSKVHKEMSLNYYVVRDKFNETFFHMKP
jgi:hypothetical protein